MVIPAEPQPRDQLPVTSKNFDTSTMADAKKKRLTGIAGNKTVWYISGEISDL